MSLIAILLYTLELKLNQHSADLGCIMISCNTIAQPYHVRAGNTYCCLVVSTG